MTSNEYNDKIDIIKRELTNKFINIFGVLSSDEVNKFASFEKIKKYFLRIRKEYLELYDYYKDALDSTKGCDDFLTMSYLFSVNPRISTDYKGYYEIICYIFNKLLVDEYRYNYYLFMDYRVLHVIKYYKGDRDDIITYFVNNYKNRKNEISKIDSVVEDLKRFYMERKTR